MTEYPLAYRFKTDPWWSKPSGETPRRPALYGRRCRVIARGSKNSILIEFDNGQREICSRNAVRLTATTTPSPVRTEEL